MTDRRFLSDVNNHVGIIEIKEGLVYQVMNSGGWPSLDKVHIVRLPTDDELDGYCDDETDLLELSEQEGSENASEVYTIVYTMTVEQFKDIANRLVS